MKKLSNVVYGFDNDNFNAQFAAVSFGRMKHCNMGFCSEDTIERLRELLKTNNINPEFFMDYCEQITDDLNLASYCVVGYVEVDHVIKFFVNTIDECRRLRECSFTQIEYFLDTIKEYFYDNEIHIVEEIFNNVSATQLSLKLTTINYIINGENMKNEKIIKSKIGDESLKNAFKGMQLKDKLNLLKDIHEEMGYPDDIEAVITMTDAYNETRICDLDDADKKFLMDCLKTIQKFKIENPNIDNEFGLGELSIFQYMKLHGVKWSRPTE